jgi:hypothetical protein
MNKVSEVIFNAGVIAREKLTGRKASVKEYNERHRFVHTSSFKNLMVVGAVIGVALWQVLSKYL